jgi:hypothetical protein
MTKKLLKENGEFSEEGNQAMSEFRLALAKLIDSDDVRDMSQAQLRTLGGLLAKETGDRISFRISDKLQRAARFEKMSDEEFETHLKEKYGDVWQFTTLNPEELARVPVLSQEKNRELLEKGAQSVAHLNHNGVRFPRR